MTEEVVYNAVLWTPHKMHGGKPDMLMCRGGVHQSIGWGTYQCSRKATVFRLVTTSVYGALTPPPAISAGFCSQHDPVKVKARADANAAKYKANRAIESAERDLKYVRPIEYRDVLRQIADGHNDPRTVAREILVKWGDES